MLHPISVNPRFLKGGRMDLLRVQSTLRPGRSISSADRFVAWLFLLQIIPPDPSAWPTKLHSLLQAYRSWLVSLGLADSVAASPPVPGDASERIHLDVVRTGRLLFFLPTDSRAQASPDESDPFFEYADHIRRIERLLRVCATVTPQCDCLQGVSEIATVFYFVAVSNYFDFKNGTFCDPSACEWSEALACFSVQQVLASGHLLPFFVTEDRSHVIAQQLEPFAALVRKRLPQSAATLASAGIEPVYYALRWFTLLFSQEHDLPSLLIIWDNLFVHFTAFSTYLRYMALAHLRSGEAALVPRNSSKSLHALQHLDVSGRAGEIIAAAERFWAADRGHR
jgi:hypothetical protein